MTIISVNIRKNYRFGFNENDTDSGNLVLKDGGYYISIDGNLIIEQVDPSWKPE